MNDIDQSKKWHESSAGTIPAMDIWTMPLVPFSRACHVLILEVVLSNMLIMLGGSSHLLSRL